MKYAAIVTYTTGERSGATFSAPSLMTAWEKVFEIFNKSIVQAVEIAEIVTPERATK